MTTPDDVRAVMQRYKQISVDELAALLHATVRETRTALATDECAEFARPTGSFYRRSPILKYVAPRRPSVEVTDDLVLAMWEKFADEDWPISRIARHFEITDLVVKRELAELGVLEPPAPRDRSGPSIDPLDPFRGVDAAEAIRRENIMAAMARVANPAEYDDTYRYPSHLPFARALPHVKPGVRKRIPQSEHQRYMDRVGSGFWAKIVRADLRSAGLLPR